MIESKTFDIRTITMGFLLDCNDPDINRAAEKNILKITKAVPPLVAVGDENCGELG